MDTSTIQVWRQPFSAKLRFSAVRQSTMDIWNLWVRIIWYDKKKKDSSTVPHFPNKSGSMWRSPHLMSSDIFSHRGSAAGTSDGCCVVGSLPPCSLARRVAWRRSRLVKWDPNKPMVFFTKKYLKKTRKNVDVHHLQRSSLWCPLSTENLCGVRNHFHHGRYMPYFPIKGWSSRWVEVSRPWFFPKKPWTLGPWHRFFSRVCGFWSPKSNGWSKHIPLAGLPWIFHGEIPTNVWWFNQLNPHQLVKSFINGNQITNPNRLAYLSPLHIITSHIFLGRVPSKLQACSP